MAHINAEFYIDLDNGNNAARTAITGCVASNPAGSTTRITKTAHGLVTGAIVDLTAFTAWLNSSWKITVVDANSFDLVNAVWTTTADNNGTVTPRGGSYADPWKTITLGPTAARIQPGDSVRLAKTQDETDTGVNAIFTNGSKTVTLASALTQTIDNGIGNTWTVSANITGSTNASRKIGATAQVLTPAAGFTTGKMAYKAVSGDLSAYTKISFWVRSTVGQAIAANQLKICICSDATGDTIVNEVVIPATFAASPWFVFTVDYGAALTASMGSVALYAITDPGTNAVSIQNIIACNTLSLTSIFGPAGDCNYSIQSLDGTTLVIDSASTTVIGRGYYGPTGSVDLYYQEPFHIPPLAATWATISEAGNTTSGFNTLTGGWDLSTQTKDGVTAIGSPQSGAGTFLAVLSYWNIDNLKFVRGGTPITGTMLQGAFTDVVFVGNLGAPSLTTFNGSFIRCSVLNSGTNFFLTGGSVEFVECRFLNNDVGGAQVGPMQFYFKCKFGNNGSYSILLGAVSDGSAFLKNCILDDTTEVSYVANTYGWLWSLNHDDTPGNNWGFSNGARANWQTTIVHASEPGAWLIKPTSTRREWLPVVVQIAEVAVAAGSPVTVAVWVSKETALNVAAKLLVRDGVYSVAGVTEQSALKADDTNWEELSVTFTPSEKGVVPVYIVAWYTGSTRDVYVGKLTVTQ
jgi:hypothetical protein